MTGGIRPRTWASAARVLLGGLCAAIALSGCATKGDMKRLRDEVVVMQARQDSLFREMQRQSRMMLDTIKAGYDAQLDAQGQTSHRFRELEQQLGRTEELVQQLFNQIEQLNTRLDQAALQPQRPVLGQQQRPEVAGGPQAEQLYNKGLSSIREGAYTTARIAFGSIVNQFPQDARAPDAQYQIGETYALEGDTEQAIAELEKVEVQWHDSPRAPASLYRAGVLAEESDQLEKARELYQRLRRNYPATDEARLAEERLRQIGD